MKVFVETTLIKKIDRLYKFYGIRTPSNVETLCKEFEDKLRSRFTKDRTYIRNLLEPLLVKHSVQYVYIEVEEFLVANKFCCHLKVLEQSEKILHHFVVQAE